MPFIDMVSEVSGSVPKLPRDYAYTLVNRAWADLRRQNLWSFQIFEANWTTPFIINTGTCTVQQASPIVTFDITIASPLIAAVASTPQLFPSQIVQRQFRVGIGTIYNIWGYSLNAGVVTLTLDRPYQEASAKNIAFMIYQCYYAAPYQDFLSWMSIRDIINFNDLNFNQNRQWVDRQDPQRSIYFIPSHVVPYQTDQNPLSQTYGWMLFELWGQPTIPITYQLYGIRKGTPLVNWTDILPPPVGEDCVVALAKKGAYEWAMANMGDQPREQGPDWKFLMGSTMAEYKRLYSNYRMQDRQTVDLWKTKLRGRVPLFPSGPYYSSAVGYANPGSAFGP